MLKKILLGVSGSIAAYKTAELTRLLVKQGLEVKVIMTDAATDFITPLTLATLSKHDVLSSVASEEGWNNHVELGLWADAYVIAPATANTIAKLANGLCDNLLTACYLSARCPVFVAPAMDVDMWHHTSTKRNILQLQSDQVHIVPVGTGELASGLIGEGRMAEPEDILAFVLCTLSQQNQATPTLKSTTGLKAMVTAGPTYEALDPVRFIGNHSSGKMGIAIAEELAANGVEVHLILGPTSLLPQNAAIQVHKVRSAQDMYNAAAKLFPTVNISVLAAAVADYRPKHVASEKIKKKDSEMSLELEKTIDIAATLGKTKRSDQITVGFALETNNEKAHALRKLETKNFDFIVLNSMQDKGAGFGHDTNKISMYFRNGTEKLFDTKPKTEVAVDIVHEVFSLLRNEEKKSSRS